jgi:malate dehydrogenase (oxaloacetate-decarboxylating)
MEGITPAQTPFVQQRDAIDTWVLDEPYKIGLLEVMRNAKPTVLIGVSGQAGAFAEPVIREMAKHVQRPVIFPLSNPTSRSEATPQHLMEWTDGRALIGTGSPFSPVTWQGKTIPVDQTNNSYIFPGIGLGVLGARAHRVTDGMFMVAAKAVAAMSPTLQDHNGRLLPPVDQLRAVSLAVAKAVARQAQADGVADPCEEATLDQRIAAFVWEPRYARYELVKPC